MPCSQCAQSGHNKATCPNKKTSFIANCKTAIGIKTSPIKRTELLELKKKMSELEKENEELKKVGFNGVLGKEQKIEDILKRIKKFKVIKDYEIKNKNLRQKNRRFNLFLICTFDIFRNFHFRLLTVF